MTDRATMARLRMQRDIARGRATALEEEIARLQGELRQVRADLASKRRHPTSQGVVILPTPARPVDDRVDDGFRCACSLPSLPGLIHSSTVCGPPDGAA